jgi:ABC-type dipeptide/oligopeptide/nickel transport system permease subunit
MYMIRFCLAMMTSLFVVVIAVNYNLVVGVIVGYIVHLLWLYWVDKLNNNHPR